MNVGIAGQHIKSVQHRGIKTRASVEEEIAQKDIDALIDDMFRLVMQPGEEIIHGSLRLARIGSRRVSRAFESSLPI